MRWLTFQPGTEHTPDRYAIARPGEINRKYLQTVFSQPVEHRSQCFGCAAGRKVGVPRRRAGMYERTLSRVNTFKPAKLPEIGRAQCKIPTSAPSGFDHLDR